MGVFGLSQIVNKLLNVRVIGDGASESFEGANTAPFVKTFSKACTGFCISNDGDPENGGTNIIIQIGADTFTIKAGEVFKARFEPFFEATIMANGNPYRAYGMIAVGTTSVPTAPPPDTTPPFPATNLVVDLKTYFSVTLKWTGSSSPDTLSYDVYQGTTIADGILKGTATSLTFTVTGLNQNAPYNFFVRAKDGANNRSETSNVVNVTTDIKPPDTTRPVLFNANPRSRSFMDPMTVTLSATDNEPGVYITYTLNGTTPISTSTRYTAPISIQGSAGSVINLKYVAYDVAGNNSGSPKSETYTYSTKVGGTGFGALPAPATGLWQHSVIPSASGNALSYYNGGSTWMGSHYYFAIEKEITHVAWETDIGAAFGWELWECSADPVDTTKLVFENLVADGTTDSAFDAGLGSWTFTPAKANPQMQYYVGALQYPILTKPSTWYMIVFNRGTNTGNFMYTSTSDFTFKNVRGEVSTGHPVDSFSSPNRPVKGQTAHARGSQWVVFGLQLYMR